MKFLTFCAAKIAGTVAWFMALIIFVSLVVVFPWVAYISLAAVVLVLLLGVVFDWHEEYSRQLKDDRK